jgi:hydroxymethylbilane synthase
MTTEGDVRVETTLASIGGKGLFMKELEYALIANEADIAVHSMKDVTVELPDGLTIGVACARGEARDALVSNRFGSLESLPAGSRVGTSSLRRRSQLQHSFPTLEFVELRGNINTRLSRLDRGDYDAIVLAGAGLIRLGMQERIVELISDEQCLPAVGQGVVGVECREDDHNTQGLLAALADSDTQPCLAAERSLNKNLGGGCHVPIAGYAILDDGQLYLRGRVGDPDGERLLKAAARGSVGDAERIGREVASNLRAQGADSILRAVYKSV